MLTLCSVQQVLHGLMLLVKVVTFGLVLEVTTLIRKGIILWYNY